MKKYISIAFLLFLAGTCTPVWITQAKEGVYPCPALPAADSEACQAAQENVEKVEKAQAPNLASEDPKVKRKAQEAVESARKAAILATLNMIQQASSGYDIRNAFQVGNEGNLSFLKPATGSEDTWILSKVIKLMAQIIGTFAILILAFGGILMITSEGDENRLQKGKNIFFYTIVGLLVAFISYIGVQFIISVLFTTTGG